MTFSINFNLSSEETFQQICFFQFFNDKILKSFNDVQYFGRILIDLLLASDIINKMYLNRLLLISLLESAVSWYVSRSAEVANQVSKFLWCFTRKNFKSSIVFYLLLIVYITDTCTIQACSSTIRKLIQERNT